MTTRRRGATWPLVYIWPMFDELADGVFRRHYEFLRLNIGVVVGEDGVLIIVSSRHREQARNREDALARLAEVVRKARVRPKTRRPTRPSAGAKERRLKAKQRRGDIKRDRGRVEGDD